MEVVGYGAVLGVDLKIGKLTVDNVSFGLEVGSVRAVEAVLAENMEAL